MRDINLEYVLFVDDIALPDTDKNWFRVPKPVGEKIFDIDETCKESGFGSIYENGMAIVGVSLEIGYSFQPHLNHLVPCVEEQGCFGCSEMFIQGIFLLSPNPREML